MTIENIKQLMDNLDIAALLPDIMSVMNGLVFLAQIALLATPLAMLGLGMYYFLIAPKEANYTAGYRCYWGMGSEEAWRFTQKLAGMVWAGLGLILSVVMLLISSTFGKMETIDLLWRAVSCVLWEAGLALAAFLTVNTVVALRYNGKGELRNPSRT